MDGVKDEPCLRHKQHVKINLLRLKQGVNRNIFDPSCNEDGFYANKQCNAGFCWCSDRDGNMIAGTKGKGVVDCGKSKIFNTNIRLLHGIYVETNGRFDLKRR